MNWLWRISRAVMIGLLLGTVAFAAKRHAVSTERIEEVRKRVGPGLREQLEKAGFRLGNPVFVRIFKESNELELWLQPKAYKEFSLFRTYPIAYYSGKLGPKQAVGDLQAPEGFYSVAKRQLNPRSSYHLAFNVGYPNAYDRALGRTGSEIMVHGSNVSIGCFAMTNPLIEEIYLIVEAALDKGQRAFAVHSFPFRMTDERLQREAGNEWLPFWQKLQKGHDLFEKAHLPPEVDVEGSEYVIRDAGSGS
jgi:murein L,D-transpeptidase YafK